jgi:hypothetical protein
MIQTLLSLFLMQLNSVSASAAKSATKWNDCQSYRRPAVDFGDVEQSLRLRTVPAWVPVGAKLSSIGFLRCRVRRPTGGWRHGKRYYIVSPQPCITNSRLSVRSAMLLENAVV